MVIVNKVVGGKSGLRRAGLVDGVGREDKLSRWNWWGIKLSRRRVKVCKRWIDEVQGGAWWVIREGW